MKGKCRTLILYNNNAHIELKIKNKTRQVDILVAMVTPNISTNYFNFYEKNVHSYCLQFTKQNYDRSSYIKLIL